MKKSETVFIVIDIALAIILIWMVYCIHRDISEINKTISVLQIEEIE